MTSELWIAIIGVGGTLAAAMFTQIWQGRREDSRLERADATRFHAHRQELYSRFLAQTLVYREWTKRVGRYYNTDAETKMNIPGLDEEAEMKKGRELLSAISLIASQEVISHATGLLGTALAGTVIVVGPDPEVGRDATVKRAKSAEDLFQSAYHDCLKAMRQDLGMTPVPTVYTF